MFVFAHHVFIRLDRLSFELSIHLSQRIIVAIRLFEPLAFCTLVTKMSLCFVCASLWYSTTLNQFGLEHAVASAVHSMIPIEVITPRVL